MLHFGIDAMFVGESRDRRIHGQSSRTVAIVIDCWSDRRNDMFRNRHIVPFVELETVRQLQSDPRMTTYDRSILCSR
jgi:hypothetical protein